MLDMLLELLNSTGIPFCAYRWDHRPAGAYGTAQLEGGADVVAADDKIIHQAVRASVDLYAPNASGYYPRLIQNALNGEFAWRLNSVQYEDRLVHYEWIVEGEAI